MKLNTVSVPRIMLQVGFCGALVVGTHLISQDRPKDSARLLGGVEDGPFTLGTKGDRMVVAANRTAAAHQVPAAAMETADLASSPATSAAAASAGLSSPAAVAASPAAAAKPKRVSVVAPPAVARHHETLPPPTTATLTPAAWSTQPVAPPPPVQLSPVAQPVAPPKPREQETFLGLPPVPTPQEFFDNTVKETNAAFGKMKQAMEDAFR